MAGQGNTVGTHLDPFKVPWFADCAPSLLTNRTIRRHLSAYSQHTWPEVIKLTLIYGVLGLEQQFHGGALSIPQLRRLVEKGGAQLVVERNLPGLQRQILDLQTNLDAVFDRLAVEPPPPAGGAAVTAQQQQSSTATRAAGQQQQQQRGVLEAAPRAPATSPQPATALNPGPVAPKPPDAWRLGEKTGFPSPPRYRDQPLRRSLDNQGATNPIYPDWWLAGGPPDPPPPKKLPAKVHRKQPRLAYSVQQQHQEVSAAADDLVTPEYLMVPGSGYGQQQPGPVVGGHGPPVTLTSITAEGLHTNPLYEPLQQQQQQQSLPAAGAGRAAAAKAPGRRPQAVQSMIRQAVAASRRTAAGRQQRRQQLLASAVAAGSSLFGAGPAAPQQHTRRGGATAAEAVAVCAPAAAAEQFLSDPWTSCFLQPSALRPDVCGFPGLPAADIAADDEARLGALLPADEAGDEAEGGLQQPRAPAAFAVLQGVVAGQAGPGEQPAAGVSAAAAAATAAAGTVDEPWSWQEQQLPEEDNGGASSLTGSKAAVSRPAVPTGGSSRGVFADITSGLNSAAAGVEQRPSSAHTAPAADGARQQAQLGGLEQQRDDLGGLGGGESWRNLPMVDEDGQQQHHHHQPQRQAWACDFGHLEEVQPPAPARPSARARRASGKPHKKWSETWVGDYGHLQEYPRFCKETAFQAGAQEAGGDEQRAEGSRPPSSKLFMSPGDLEALVAAADRLAHTDQPQAAAAPAAAAGDDPGSVGDRGGAAAWEAGVGRGGSGDDGQQQGTSAVHSLAARFNELLSRWDAQAAGSAAELPAGVAAKANVSHAAAPAAAYDSDTPEAHTTAVAAGAATQGFSSSSASPQGGGIGGGGISTGPAAAGGSGLGSSRQASTAAAVDAAALGVAADTAALLRDLQAAVSELSSTGESDTGCVEGEAAADATPAAVGEADQWGGEASSVSLPAEGHLEGMQEASQMLQQALSRHDALMQLIASLGAPGSGSDALLSSAASGSEFTL